MDTIYLSKFHIPNTFLGLLKLMIITGIVGIMHLVLLYWFCLTWGMSLSDLKEWFINLINLLKERF
jgi:hypothetical protein